MDTRPMNWQNVIWRAWRHTDDREFADRLFETVADEPVGWGVTISLLFLGAFYGAAAGLAIGLITTHWGIENSSPLSMFDSLSSAIGLIATHWGIESKDLVLSYQRLLSFVLWGAVAGGLVAGFIRGFVGRRLTCHAWLKWLLPSVPPSDSGVTLFCGLVVGLFGGLVGMCVLTGVGLFCGFFGVWIGSSVDILVFILVVGLYCGLVGGSLGGSLGGLYGGLFGGLYGGLFGGLFGGLGVSLGGGLFGGLVGGLGWHRAVLRYDWDYRRWLWWWRGQVHPFALEQALRHACEQRDAARERWAEPLRRLEMVRGESRTLQQWLAALRNPDWVEATAAGHRLVALGGEAVEPLQSLLPDSKAEMRRTAADLIRDIAEDTSSRLAAHASRLLCVRCLVRCHAHQVRLSGRNTGTARRPFPTYYGCRACHQSREFLDWSGEVVAVLDAGMSDERLERAGVLRVNYLVRGSGTARSPFPTVFDFNRVEIAQATDEEVERFAVQVGNDTDEFRRPRYRQMTCAVSSECRLSENTMRILRSMFGEVVVK